MKNDNKVRELFDIASDKKRLIELCHSADSSSIENHIRSIEVKHCNYLLYFCIMYPKPIFLTNQIYWALYFLDMIFLFNTIFGGGEWNI